MADTEEDFRQPVSADLEPYLRLYRRLWLAQVDLDEAKAAVNEILRANLPISRRDRPSPLLLSFTTAFVVAYSRPWVYSRGQSVAERTVPGSLLRSLTSKQREMHDFLIELRNKEMAHTDADITEIHLMLHKDGHAAILRTSREAFLRSDLKLIHRIIEKLERAVVKRCEELRLVLPNEIWI